MNRKKIVVLGSTGSIGKNVIDVAQRHNEVFEIVGLAAHSNVRDLAGQCDVLSGTKFAIGSETAHTGLLKDRHDLSGRSVGAGAKALLDLLDETRPDLVVNSLVGFVGLEPTLKALSMGIDVALANKEAIVTGGELVRRAAGDSGAEVIPIDSEHVAISQCLRGSALDDVKAVFVTASGGALREFPLDALPSVTRDDVLAHPTWNMGDKITVDSATLVNKGLEVIEAHWLFDLPYERIRIVIHPQSIVHSLVEFRDNSIVAQLAEPDMRLPILYALSYPDRIESDVARSDVLAFPALTFAAVDAARYPCFELVMSAARAGGNMPTVLNAANEMAVGAFLAGSIEFTRIHKIIASALEAISKADIQSLDDVFESDRATRTHVKEKFGV